MSEETKVKDLTGVANKDLTPAQRRARKAAKAGRYTDKDLDGIPDKDQVDWTALQDEWQWISKLIEEVPEIAELVEKHVNLDGLDTEIGQRNFINDVIDSDWWETNAASAREAFRIRTTDPAQYNVMLGDARRAIQARANTLGAQVNESILNDLADRFVTEGWSNREDLIDAALSQKIGTERVVERDMAAGDLASQLREIAMSNGLRLDEQYYVGAARSVAGGFTSAQQQIRELREMAAGNWPSFADQIRAGLDARTLASGYINLMSRTLEVDANGIDLNDPFIRKALTRVDDKGTARPMSLWEFNEDLRNDPRWMQTDQAVQQVSDIGTRVLERFGIL